MSDRTRRCGHRVGVLAAAVMLALGTFLLVPVGYEAITILPSDRGDVPPAMTKLAEFRQNDPEYNGLSDRQRAEALHAKFDSEMDRTEFDRQAGLVAASGMIEIELPDGTIAEFPAGTDRDIIELAIAEEIVSTAPAVASTRVWDRLLGGMYLFLFFAALAAAAYVAVAWAIAALFDDH